MDPADRLTAGHDAFQSIHEGLSNQHPQDNGTHDTVNQTRTQRIHRGFHRIGAVLAGMILALGMVVVGVIAVEEADKIRTVRFDISTAKPDTISVRLPNGVIVRNVPHGTTKQQLIRILGHFLPNGPLKTATVP